MDLRSVNSIYFLGIGGIGMSALARYFLWQGKTISGYDKVCTPLTIQLEKEGMHIHYTDDPELIPAHTQMVVYTPAVPYNSKEFVFLMQQETPVFKRAEVLGMISATVPTIAVAGTHGKTTVTTIIAHIFKVAGVKFSAFMGGISVNYNTNFLGTEDPNWVIAEADEYDRSFLQLSPQIAVITSMDADHLDVYGTTEKLEESFRLFGERVHKEGVLITHKSLNKLNEIHRSQKDYGLSLPAHFGLETIALKDGKYHCMLQRGKERLSFDFAVPGRHNLENAVAAAAASLEAGIPWPAIQNALATYKGVKRRFEIHVNTPEVVYVDDYAHHPREITACVQSAREFFPGRKLAGIFQPHLYSRTRDLAEDFAKALDLLDWVVLLDIYPAREMPIEGVDVHSILDKMQCKEKSFVADEDLLQYVADRKFDVLITMGAGDIDRFVQPITNLLNQ